MTDNDWRAKLAALNLPDSEPQLSEPQPSEPDANPYAKHPRLEVVLDRKGRKGKDATIVAGFTLDDNEVAEIASKLKSKLGTGGSSRGGEILIQGDRRANVAAMLQAMGFKVITR